ncbi:spinster -like protein [Labeo rohita]|uniref:Spinster-like protein n=1 Tax=Labeo rohita TaxID=84645 RepID=A0A498P3Y3_LABRO|nr:spinster -like protein [Labeo rohita]
MNVRKRTMAEMVSDSDVGVPVSDPPKQPPKRRRILDASSITTVPVYSNKVNSSLNLKPITFKHTSLTDEEKGAPLWSPSPPRPEKRPISIDLSGSEEEPEQTEAQEILRSPSPPPPPCSPPVKRSRRANQKIREINKKLNEIGSLTAPLSKAVEELAIKLNVQPSQILLLNKDIDLPIHSSISELGLGIADIIDCVVTENKQEESDKSNVITVRLQGKEKESVQEYSLQKNAPLGSILSQYVSGLSATARWKAKFLFDGSRVSYSQTPAELDMEDAVMSRTDVSADTTPFFSDDTEGEGPTDNGVGSPQSEEEEPVSGVSDRRAKVTVAVLCYINLLNYMDRFTVAGVLPDIEHFFNISDGTSGLLQTVFICSYMFLAPLFGYLGDRSAGLSFLSGLGYIVGSKVDDVAGDWHWALRVTPGLGLLAVILLFVVVQEPKRGAIEARPEHPLQRTSWLADIKALCRNPSFVLSTFGFTTVAFVTGSLALWAPAFLFRAGVFTGEKQPCLKAPCDNSDSLIFGIITVVTGILGVASGVQVSKKLRIRTPRADPLVCSAGLLLAAPFLYLSIMFAEASTVATYVFIFLGETFLSMNWAIVADILLYVVIPTRRSTAEAFQIVLSHLLGDAISPYLIGVVSDSIKKSDSYMWEFRSLQMSLLLCSFVAVGGGAFFLATAIFIEKDRELAENYVPSVMDSTALLSVVGGAFLLSIILVASLCTYCWGHKQPNAPHTDHARIGPYPHPNSPNTTIIQKVPSCPPSERDQYINVKDEKDDNVPEVIFDYVMHTDESDSDIPDYENYQNSPGHRKESYSLSRGSQSSDERDSSDYVNTDPNLQ